MLTASPSGSPTPLPSHAPDWAIVKTHDQISGFGATDVQSVHEDYGLTGLGQTVVVIDTGVAYDHYALGGGLGTDFRVVGGWDFAENDADPFDDGPVGYHGTHVAGIIGSSDGQYAGVAPSVDIVALRVFDDDGNGNLNWIESALQWVHEHQHDFEHPITTVNMSLGVEWNETTVPAWAMLEDELLQLKQAGIFTAVSAGNSFSTYESVGLGYPAASEHVVPVASYGADGLLSSFSQRSDRVIVAPGELVMSTAPDYISGFDGVTDDFARSSGTSMAAPYVAGASVLVREAFEIAGRTQLDQDTIYQHLLATSESVFDSATDQYYQRLDLQAAVQYALPADDAGDTPDTARHIGTIFDAQGMDGMFTSTADRDYWTFVAGETGEVELTFNNYDAAEVHPQLAGASRGDSADTLRFDVVAGESYSLLLENSGGIGRYAANFELTKSPVVHVDLGEVDVASIQQQPTQSSRYRLTAAHNGWLTISAAGKTTGQVTLEDGEGNPIATGSLHDGQVRFDYRAAQGETLFLEVANTIAPLDVRLTNLVQVDGSQIHLYATVGQDRFVVRAGSEVSVSVNGETYTLDGNRVANVRIVDASDADEVWIFGTDGNDRASVSGSTASMESEGDLLTVSGSQRYSLIGRGGDDAIVIFDTAKDDIFTGRRDFALITSAGSRHFASGFEQVTMQSIHGGEDLVMLYGSEGDDALRMGAQVAEMQYDTSKITTAGFERVRAFSNQGGQDTATMMGTGNGTDRFIARPTAAFFEGNGFQHQARNFDTVHLYSTGAEDHALLYDSPGEDDLIIAGKSAVMRGTVFSIHLHDFESMTAIANAGGSDRITSRDVGGFSRYIGLRELDIFESDDYRHVVRGFEMTTVESQGDDTAILYAAIDGSDRLAEFANLAILTGPDYIKTTTGFSELSVIGETNSGFGILSVSTPNVQSMTQELPVVVTNGFVTGDPLLRVRLSRPDFRRAAKVAETFSTASDAGPAMASKFAPVSQEVDHAVSNMSTVRSPREIADDIVDSELEENLDITTRAFRSL